MKSGFGTQMLKINGGQIPPLSPSESSLNDRVLLLALCLIYDFGSRSEIYSSVPYTSASSFILIKQLQLCHACIYISDDLC